jgi:hypothetical protein
MRSGYDLMVSREQANGLFTLDDVALHCGLHPSLVKRLVLLGLIDPEDGLPYRFRPEMVLRLQRGLRLRRDLGIGYQATALVLDLLERIEHLEVRLRHLERP